MADPINPSPLPNIAARQSITNLLNEPPDDDTSPLRARLLFECTALPPEELFEDCSSSDEEDVTDGGNDASASNQPPSRDGQASTITPSQSTQSTVDGRRHRSGITFQYDYTAVESPPKRRQRGASSSQTPEQLLFSIVQRCRQRSCSIVSIQTILRGATMRGKRLLKLAPSPPFSPKPPQKHPPSLRRRLYKIKMYASIAADPPLNITTPRSNPQRSVDDRGIALALLDIWHPRPLCCKLALALGRL